MTFYEMVEQILELLQRHGRVTHRALKRQFDIDDDFIEDLKDELLHSKYPIAEEDGRSFIWTGEAAAPEGNHRHWGGSEGRFQAALLAVTTMLQRDRRVTYRTLQYIFSLDDTLLGEIREELSFRRLATDEDGEGLVWTGKTSSTVKPGEAASRQQSTAATGISPASTAPQPYVTATDTITNGSLLSPVDEPVESLSDEQMSAPQHVRSIPEAERRQLTVMFCDLVGSTDLSGRLDPEDLREVVRAYQETAAEVIERYEGHIAQYLGDGLLIYFGYPMAHEDDAQRAVHTGLGIVEAMGDLNTRLAAAYGVELAVRIGIHTGPVVVGEMGGGDRHENLALGETPNVAARLEGFAQPNAVVISSVTARLVQRGFDLECLGLHDLKGVSEPMMISRVLGAAEPESVGPATQGFDALVGRDEEIGLLSRRWEQAKEGVGQAVLLSGEAGIGKSSLVEGLRRHVRQAGDQHLAFRCSPYHTHSALYPIIGTLQRVLGWEAEDPVDVKFTKLEQGVENTHLVRDEAVPIMASLMSLDVPEERYPPLTLSPQQQRQQTQDILGAWLQELAERQPILVVWEDLHWADPSTLELLGLFVNQAPTAPILHLMTYRPDFEPPWPTRSHVTPIMLNRLERSQAEALMAHLAAGKRLPTEVVEHLVAKTDGVPLYVEELTQMLLASELLREEADQYVLTGPLTSMSIPDTLQDSLMARLDQMQVGKDVAQLGAVLGREFSYEMLHGIATQDEETLQSGLAQLVDTELLYQRGRPPHARYLFKHALIQDAAYTSLLRSTRQRVHQQIAEQLETRFPEIAETQPELVAHHYTEGSCYQPAVNYWQRAGQRFSEQSANVEAVRHLTMGLGLLDRLPHTLERDEQELGFQILLGAVFLMSKGHGAPEVEHAYRRAQELCQQLDNKEQLFPVLFGLWRCYIGQPKLHKALEIGERLLSLAKEDRGVTRYVVAHYAFGFSQFCLGEIAAARVHLEEGIARYTPEQRHFLAFRTGQDPGVACQAYTALSLWLLGYPDQALVRIQHALTLARDLSHPFSLAFAGWAASFLHQFRREVQATQEQSQAVIDLAVNHGFSAWEAQGKTLQSWGNIRQNRGGARPAQIHEGIDDWQSQGARSLLHFNYTLLVDAHTYLGQIEEARQYIVTVKELMETYQERWWQAEVYRLEGQLHLQGAHANPLSAEACYNQALDVSRRQQAKSLELRAATSLARLWQSQGKRQEAYDLLAPVYEWFTEGFDTADLIDAKKLLDELGEVAS